uniref:Uncharacterized protein n=1 Tax=viral metagenome TaxID=1070528 RepID=A0A6C0HP88_9ZZZZ
MGEKVLVNHREISEKAAESTVLLGDVNNLKCTVHFIK